MTATTNPPRCKFMRKTRFTNAMQAFKSIEAIARTAKPGDHIPVSFYYCNPETGGCAGWHTTSKPIDPERSWTTDTTPPPLKREIQVYTIRRIVASLQPADATEFLKQIGGVDLLDPPAMLRLVAHFRTVAIERGKWHD